MYNLHKQQYDIWVFFENGVYPLVPTATGKMMILTIRFRVNNSHTNPYHLAWQYLVTQEGQFWFALKPIEIPQYILIYDESLNLGLH